MNDRPVPSSIPRPFAVVTGASSGIGLAVAQELARRGWGTFLLARRMHLLTAAARELSQTAPSIPIGVDLADPGAAEAVAAEILDTHGPVDALVNNAGFGLYRPFLEHAPADHARLMQVNYFSSLSLIRSFLPSMIAQGHGTVVNVSSSSAKMGPWGHAGYAASKAAMRALTECLHAEHAPRGVRFSCVFPGIVDTPYFEKAGWEALYAKMRSHAISAERCARGICNVIQRPRVWASIPGHYRLLDAIAAFSPRLAHAIVARSSQVGSSIANVAPNDAVG